jgi:hypothetical protein
MARSVPAPTRDQVARTLSPSHIALVTLGFLDVSRRRESASSRALFVQKRGWDKCDFSLPAMQKTHSWEYMKSGRK